jgi:hypothetical protein
MLENQKVEKNVEKIRKNQKKSLKNNQNYILMTYVLPIFDQSRRTR